MALRKPNSAPLTLGALAAAGVLALTACGEGDDGTITIGVEASYPPGEYLDEDGETVLGFNVELLTAALNEMGIEPVWEPTSFDSIIIGVDTGTYDMGASSFTITEERMEQVNMVSYFSSGTQWFAQTGNPEGVDPDNACGMRIAVQANTTHDTDIEARSEACVEAGEEAITIQKFDNQPLATETVVSGVNDASLADLPTSLYALQQTDEQLEFIGDQYDAAPYGILLHQDDTELSQELADAFNTIIENGTYQEILDEWGIEGGALDVAEVNPSVEE